MRLLIQNEEGGCPPDLLTRLQDAGHRVLTRSVTAEAVDCCSRDYIHAAFIPLDPESADDVARIRWIRERSPHLLLILTGKSFTRPATVAALRLGVFDLLEKPLTATDDVVDLVNRAENEITSLMERRSRMLRIREQLRPLSHPCDEEGEVENGTALSQRSHSHYFLEVFDLELRRARRYDLPFSIISLRIPVAELPGGQKADPHLKRLVESVTIFLGKRLRRSDLFFRTDIDEFLVILTETPKEGAVVVVDNLRRAVNPLVASYCSAEREVAVEGRLRIGHSTFPDDGEDGGVLLERARRYEDDDHGYAAPVSVRPTAPRGVMVVDYDEGVRSVISRVLKEKGYEVTEAGSGEEALRIFENSPRALVFTDVHMGGMSGFELLRSIKGLNPETEVIIVTSHASLDSSLSALRSGAYDYLVKPFESLETISNVAARAMEKFRLVEENRQLLENLKEKNEELHFSNLILTEAANRDGLTGLFNHRFFQEMLQSEIIRSKRYNHSFALLFIDVDHFKLYNDMNGHPEGDKVLRRVARILRESLRQSDFTARYGGEEFAAILPQTEREAAFSLAERIRTTIAAYPFPGGDRQPAGELTVSIGVASFPGDASDPGTLLTAADRALYHAKESGRNMVR